MPASTDSGVARPTAQRRPPTRTVRGLSFTGRGLAQHPRPADHHAARRRRAGRRAGAASDEQGEQQEQRAASPTRKRTRGAARAVERALSIARPRARSAPRPRRFGQQVGPVGAVADLEERAAPAAIAPEPLARAGEVPALPSPRAASAELDRQQPRRIGRHGARAAAAAPGGGRTPRRCAARAPWRRGACRARPRPAPAARPPRRRHVDARRSPADAHFPASWP